MNIRIEKALEWFWTGFLALFVLAGWAGGMGWIILTVWEAWKLVN